MTGGAEITNRVAAVRQQRGISAAALAQAVGVSRQTIYAVEAGTYVPNTATSLRMAQTLGVDLNELFRLKDAPPDPGSRSQKAALLPGQPPLLPGQAVQLCKVGAKLVAMPAEPAEWCLPASDAVMQTGNRVRPHDDDSDFASRILVAGCDPAMGMLARYLDKAGVQLVLLHQNSSRSLRLLKDGYAHLAGSHLATSNVEAVNEMFAARSVALISFALWQEGLVTAPGNPKSIRAVEDLARPDLHFVNREEGAASRVLLDSHLDRLGIPAKNIRGYDTAAPGHLAAARQVKTGAADCCLSTEAAARLFGLHFIPLQSVRYDLAVRQQQLDTPGVQALFESISQLAFRKMLNGMAGYDTSVTGNRVL